jgi:F420-non-reducing hydrogenase small subunit
MKLKIAIYWGAACGGCDVAILDTHEKLLEIADAADIYLWPVAMDFKYDDVRALPDGSLDAALYSGAIRNSENEEIAQLLRRKAKIMIALGACAHLGGIPGLANMSTREEVLRRVYLETESTANPEKTIPLERATVEGYDLGLPRFYNTVKTLDQVVDVDYTIPGCPPASLQIYSALGLVADDMLPRKGSIIGAGDRALCDECARKKSEKTISRIYRPHEKFPDAETCFLEQGLICLGPATRSGCGSRCIKSGIPCRGCYGPLDDVADQGMKMMSALASVIEPKDEKEINAVLDQFVDPLRTLHRFSLAASMLRRKKA